MLDCGSQCWDSGGALLYNGGQCWTFGQWGLLLFNGGGHCCTIEVTVELLDSGDHFWDSGGHCCSENLLNRN